MIGTGFLLRLLMIGFYVVLFLIILYAVIFAITWTIRAFIEGVGATMSDHATWLRSKMPTVKFKKQRRKPRKQ